jgi:hypothetical protein
MLAKATSNPRFAPTYREKTQKAERDMMQPQKKDQDPWCSDDLGVRGRLSEEANGHA